MHTIAISSCDECPFDGVETNYDEYTCGLYLKLTGDKETKRREIILDCCPLKEDTFILQITP